MSGEIEDAEVVIEKDREIELPFQMRNFEKIPPPVAGPQGIEQNYSFTNLNLTVPASQADIKALKLEEEPLEKYYGNLVKLGYGNYASPLAELYLYNKRNEQYLYGAQARHLSFGKGPVDGKNSSSGESSLRLEGSYFGKSATLGAGGFYRLNNWNYYGYNPGTELNEDTLLHRFHRYGVSLDVDNAAAGSATDFDLRLAYTGQLDNYEVSENWTSLRSGLGFVLNDQFKMSLDLSGDVISYATENLDRNRQRIGVEPAVVYDAGTFSVTAGLRYIYQSDTALAASQIYPVLKGSYRLNDAVGIYAELSGDNELVTWHSLTDKNPYLGILQDVHNANRILNLEAGVKGNTSFLSYKLGLNRSVYTETAFFVNRPGDPSKFDLVYESGEFKVLDFFASMGLLIGNALSVNLAANAFHYSSETFEDVPHLPAYRLVTDVDYLFFNKVRTRAGVIFMGGISGYDTVGNESRELDAATDVFLKLEYLLSKRASVFFDLNNLAGQQYQLLSNYPARGLAVKGGFSYSF